MLLLIYKCDIPLKLTIAKGLVLWEEMLPWGLKSSYLYIVIGLYVYIGIALFVYSFIACLKHGGIAFFISIFYFCSLLRPLFFMIVVAVSLSIGFLRCKGMAVLSDTKHQAMPYSAKTFPESFHKCCTFGFSKKLSTELFGVLTPRNHHFLMHVKRLYDDEMTEW